MKVFIYSLADPRDGVIKYIGKTNNVEVRLKNHINPARYKNTLKFNWIRDLRYSGLIPILDIIEVVEAVDGKERERYWIKFYIDNGNPLTNNSDGVLFGNITSFKKGNKSWNEGKGNSFTCLNCGKKTKAPPAAKRMYCSIKCYQNHCTSNKGRFKKGHMPWSKNKSGYKLKSIPVIQMDMNLNFIREFSGCKEASTEFKCNSENIRNACVGRSKTAMGFKWKYKQNNRI